jgi:hypothetical protein
MIGLHERIPDRPQVRLRTADVVSVQGASGTCTITLGSIEMADIPFLNLPTANAACYVLQDGAVLLVLGDTPIP